nr:barstar family protein [Ornithinimicrobium cryptoxanthini]
MGETMRGAQAAIATALRLPETAGRNLDALVDSLRDLALWWPESDKIVLVLHEAQALVDADLPGWHTLTEILREASTDLWRDGGAGDRAFETVALVDGHGVLALQEGSADGEAGA